MPDSAGFASWSTVVSIAFGSSVLGTLAGKLLDRGGARSETIRDGYADAVKAMNAWGQFPLRVYRRVDDSAQTLVRLEALAADSKEALAYATGWVSGESVELGRVYNALVQLLRAEVTIAARLAWSSPPVSTGNGMNIGAIAEADDRAAPDAGQMPAEWMILQEFSSLIQYRIGWRRYLWTRPLLRRRIAQRRIIERAKAEFANHSARLLNMRLVMAAQERGEAVDRG
ncbi:hypothetical protein [Kribbella sp. NPDC006257]|uniref:hypothetical protein n=1 Tax=Kribbella sp. NPDC006257 TaxID=3156738 RepID=UPI0033B25F7A